MHLGLLRDFWVWNLGLGVEGVYEFGVSGVGVHSFGGAGCFKFGVCC